VSRRLALAAGAAALLLAGTACGERQEPTGPLVQLYPVTVQGAGDSPTAVRSIPHRIVPLGSGPRTTLRALGLERRTVTVNDSLVGLPLVDQIRRARPDLIVASTDADPLDLARARAATHAAVYVEPDTSLDDVEHAIGQIGLLTGAPVAARRVTASIVRARERVAARLSGEPVVSAFVDLGNFTTVPDRSLIGDLLAKAHGKSVAGPSPEQGPFPLGRLVKLNPQVYIALAGTGTTLARLRADPATVRLQAVRKGRFAVIPGREVAPGPEVGIALTRIAHILHANAFR